MSGKRSDGEMEEWNGGKMDRKTEPVSLESLYISIIPYIPRSFRRISK
jgi:hypothetical protein